MRKFRNGTKKVAAIGLCGIMLLGLTACGAKASNDMAYEMEQVYTQNAGSAWDTGVSFDAVTEESMDFNMKAEYGMADSIVESPKLESSAPASSESQAAVTTRKVIKTANLNLQTLDFDAFQSALDAKIAESDAYLQYADVSGTDYYGGRKSANYTIRVPEANLSFFLAGVEGIATVTNKTVGEEDVTLSYVDTEARIKTLQIEQERLLALLEKADDLEYIIKLEQRLSEVRYNIESFQSRLRTYDDKITYSTVRIYVYEVTRVQEKAPETLLERISNGWKNTMYEISEGAQDFLVWFVINLPYLAFWAVVIVVAVVVLKKKCAKRKVKKLGKTSDNNETVLDSQE
ncbi:MAG: DUF4349 domain-containing protein [Lachnospiraceae bacterium]|nr:DUF4349 domain-containing protein [Lachnospiraceae bacterium]